MSVTNKGQWKQSQGRKKSWDNRVPLSGPNRFKKKYVIRFRSNKDTALFLSNRLLSRDFNLNVAKKWIGLLSNIGGVNGGRLDLELDVDKEEEDDVDKIDDSEDGMNELSLSYW